MSITGHVDDAGRTTEWCLDAAAPAAGVKLNKKKVNCGKHEGGNEIKKSTYDRRLTLNIRPSFNDQSHAKPNFKPIRRLTTERTTFTARTLLLQRIFMPMTELQQQLPYRWCRWRNVEKYVRIQERSYLQLWGPKDNGCFKLWGSCRIAPNSIIISTARLEFSLRNLVLHTTLL